MEAPVTLDVDQSWRYFSTSARNLTTTCQNCPDAPYLSLTLPHPSHYDEPGTVLHIRRIVFTTVSHDQGYSDTVGQRLYDHSHTYFDVHIVGLSGHETVPRRRLQYNVRAQSEFKTHVICWDYRDARITSDGGKDDDAGIAGWHKAGLSLKEWLDGIQSGDTIQIIPKAEYPEWKNFVSEARIEVWAEALVTAHQAASTHPGNDYSAYRQLDVEKREIRLVEIKPRASDNDADELIELSLQYTALSDLHHISYEALSYTWGDHFSRQTIYVRDGDKSTSAYPMSINSNLFGALRHLRQRKVSRVMWIDLLSINQTNIVERSQQVALMGDIFAAATAVPIWLGEISDHVREDFKVLHSIANAYVPTKTQPVETSLDAALCHVKSPDSSGSVGISGLSSLPPPRKSHAIIADSEDETRYYQFYHDRLFQRQWFQRVWVLQEAWNTAPGCETRGRIKVLCGDHDIPWEVVLHADQCLRTKHQVHKNHTMPNIWPTLFQLSRDSLPLGCKPAPRRDILSIIISALELKATDPRDKIFALLTFGDETHRISTLPDLVRPDYLKNTAHVYADFTRWWIQYHNSLKVLSAIHTLHGRTWLNMSGPNSSQKLDLSQRPSWTLWSDGRSEWQYATLALRGSCPYRASGDRLVDLDLLASSRSTNPVALALKGTRITSIAAVSPYNYYQQPISSHGIREAYNAIFAPTLVKGLWTVTDIDLQNADFETLARVSEEPDHERAAMDHIAAHRAGKSGDETYLPCHGNCELETADGACGLCPSGTQVGDIVVILNGGKVPYLLRPTKTPFEFHLIGECYVEGIMYGEALVSTSCTLTEEVFLLV